MTTASWSTVLDQTSDAAFRTWGSELSTKFAAVGMVQTADTGQINWTTITRGVVLNTAVGYEIWRLSGSALFFKIEYGTGNPQPNSPSLWLTVGTGSNGSGTLTGQTTTRAQIGGSGAPTSTVTNYQSYLCATADFFGLSWKIGSATVNNAKVVWVVARTVDSTGTATNVGYILAYNNASVGCTTQCVATTLAITGAALSTGQFLIPNNGANPPASSLDGSGNNQAFLYWFSILGSTPMVPILHFTATLLTDLSIGVTASMTLIGTTPHTYLAATISMGGDAGNSVSRGSLALTMLWE